jgi:hypothetical protein
LNVRPVNKISDAFSVTVCQLQQLRRIRVGNANGKPPKRLSKHCVQIEDCRVKLFRVRRGTVRDEQNNSWYGQVPPARRRIHHQETVAQNVHGSMSGCTAIGENAADGLDCRLHRRFALMRRKFKVQLRARVKVDGCNPRLGGNIGAHCIRELVDHHRNKV